MKNIFKLAALMVSWAKEHLTSLVVAKLTVIVSGLIIVLLAISVVVVEHVYDFRDKDPDRGAATVKQDPLGDSYTTIKYLDQNWDAADSLWFYSTTMGSNLMPYDFFLVLEKPGESQLFRSDENMNFYRYLPQKKTSSNPDGLPVGWVKDIYKGKEYVGLTCAACHTSQINYSGIGIRIDGGPATADMENIMIGLAKALKHTRENAEVKQRFVKNVLEKGNYKTEADVLADLSKYEQRISSYTYINASQISYGYARLDAFGRIYNRVLEQLINVSQFKELLLDYIVKYDHLNLDKEELEKLSQRMEELYRNESIDLYAVFFDSIPGTKYISLIKTEGAEKDPTSAIYAISSKIGLTNIQTALLNNAMFNRPDAPVSYPFLWDTPYLDYVHWNGLMSNAELGPLYRNAGEVIGAFGTLTWTEKQKIDLSSIIYGKGFTSPSASFGSSIKTHNLLRLEQHLKSLQSPQWPENILGPIDRSRANRGILLFKEYCADCHTTIDRDDPKRRIVAKMSRVSDIGTDSTTAMNNLAYSGYSGILRNDYLTLNTTNTLIPKIAPAAELMIKSTQEMSSDGSLFNEGLIKYVISVAHSFVYKFISNEIKYTTKYVDGQLPTTYPLASLDAYKARSLNGIWATAPYLHNGSVPTLHDLLLPRKREGDPEDGEYRPDQFKVGSREFDPVKVGLKSSGHGGFPFDTSFPGNSNAGHEYTSGKTARSDGKILKPLTKEERLDLLEYLKTL